MDTGRGGRNVVCGETQQNVVDERDLEENGGWKIPVGVAMIPRRNKVSSAGQVVESKSSQQSPSSDQ